MTRFAEFFLTNVGAAPPHLKASGAALGRANVALHSGSDRRVSHHAHWDLIVEIGVNYFRTVSAAHAITFMEMNSISTEVIIRVTSAPHARRKTKWELHVDEATLRRALGARPLLAGHQGAKVGLHNAAQD